MEAWYKHLEGLAKLEKNMGKKVAFETSLEKLIELDLKNKMLTRHVKGLWGLLDDISTAGDMFKPEITPYFKYVNNKCEERSNHAESKDGFTLEIKQQG